MWLHWSMPPRAQYDSATIKLLPMGIAIAGWRLSTGAWPRSQTGNKQFCWLRSRSYRPATWTWRSGRVPLSHPSENELITAERERPTLDADRERRLDKFGQPALRTN